MKKKAFTLVELLVVIAIIAVLMAIMMPALSRVKESAKRTICGTHQKDIGNAFNLYCTKMDGKIGYTLGMSNEAARRRSSSYYTTTDTGKIDTMRISNLGHLIAGGIIEPDSDIFYCPSKKQLFGSDMKLSDYNPHGDKDHWNYIGSEPGASHPWLDKFAVYTDWMPIRLNVGMRDLHLEGIKRYEQASSGTSYVTDIFSANPTQTYWNTHINDLPHVIGKSLWQVVLYFDGHVENVKLKEEYFILENGKRTYLDAFNWNELFEDGYIDPSRLHKK